MQPDELCFLDATALAALIRAGEVSPVEVVGALRERAERLDPRINAIVAWAPDAGARALAAERAVARGDDLGPLHGVPFTVKDTLDVAGLPTTRGSLLFADNVPARDATAVARLRAAGGFVLAKTNTPEFALWWETDNRVYGRTDNPWALDRTAGGSSGGEAAALAAGLTPIGLGSDLGGSIRVPAHACGVVGYKPSHGRVPLTGHFPETLARFMHVGPLARSVRDCALALPLLSGADGRDFHALPIPAPGPFAAPGEAAAALPPLRIAVLAEAGYGPVAPEVAAAVRAAAAALAALGATVEEVEAPWLAGVDCNTLTMTVYACESRPFFERLVTGREDELHHVLARRLGAPLPPLADYVAAEETVERFRNDATRFFSSWDLLLSPTVPIPAPPHAAETMAVAGEQLHPRSIMRGTLPWDVTGQPALALPWGFTPDGLPLGVQLVGRRLDDATVLGAGMALEPLGPDRGRRPPL